jgi:hypothetical protein
MPLKYKKASSSKEKKKIKKIKPTYLSEAKKPKPVKKKKTQNINYRHNDKWVIMLNFLAIFSWVLLLFLVFLYTSAAPERSTFYDTRFNKNVRTTWDYRALDSLFQAMMIGLGLSSIGLIININRHHRRTDRYRISLVILNLVSIIGIFIYVFFFN